MYNTINLNNTLNILGGGINTEQKEEGKLSPRKYVCVVWMFDNEDEFLYCYVF